MTAGRYEILICCGPTCGDRRGARDVYEGFRAALARRGLSERVNFAWQRCFGRCARGPNALVRERSGAAAETSLGAGNQPTPTPSEARRAGGASHQSPLGEPACPAAMYSGLRGCDADLVVREHVGAGRIAYPLAESPPPGRDSAPRGGALDERLEPDPDGEPGEGDEAVGPTHGEN